MPWSTPNSQMDPSLYRAAVGGNFKTLLQNNHRLEDQVTGTNNTVLHVATLFGQLNTVKKILKVSPLLLCRKNSKGETSLHIAAREGHCDIIKALIKCAKTLNVELESGARAARELLRMTIEDRDTALHEATRSQHTEAVRFLVNEDQEFSYPANEAEETPVYLAAEGGNFDLLSVILDKCTSPDYNGPGGRSALHGAVTSNSQECTAKILRWKPALTKEVDKFGWTPLHCAAHCGSGSLLLAKQLLVVDKSTAYAADNEDKNTALHIAASQGHLDLVKELITQCPDCWEMVNSKGHNILHIAVVNGYWRMTKFIVRDDTLNSLVNQKDVDGNTPLHLLVTSPYHLPELIDHPTVRKNAFNKENLTPLEFISDACWGGTKGHLKKGGAILGRRNIGQKIKTNKEGLVPRDVRKMGDTHLIVATLIATMTFAAGFTVPGGYDGNPGPQQGMAILTREAAFKAFIVTDTIALICSASAIFIYFWAQDLENYYKLLDNYLACSWFIVIAMGAMLLAFITGTFAVLAHSSGIAITVCVIGCISFLIFYVVLRKTFRSPVKS